MIGDYFIEANKPFDAILFLKYCVMMFGFFTLVWTNCDKTNKYVMQNAVPLSYSILITIFSTCSVFFVSSKFAYLVYACSIVGLLFDLTTGLLYYPKEFPLVEGYIHHIAHILVTLFGIKNNIIFQTTPYWLIELPTFILNFKRVYNIQNAYYDALFGASFLTFRIFLFTLIGVLISDTIISTGAIYIHIIQTILHVYWFNTWFRRTYRKYMHPRGDACKITDSPI